MRQMSSHTSSVTGWFQYINRSTDINDRSVTYSVHLRQTTLFTLPQTGEGTGQPGVKNILASIKETGMRN